MDEDSEQLITHSLEEPDVTVISSVNRPSINSSSADSTRNLYNPDDDESESVLGERSRKFPQYLAAFSATLAAFAAGTVLAWTSPAVPLLEHDKKLPISEYQASWMSGLMTLGAATTTIPAGFFMNRFGRKVTLLILVVPFVVGWCLVIFAKSVAMYYIGRYLLGMSSGAASVAAPVYVGEIAEKSVRGTLGSFFQLMVTSGILFTYIVGAYVSVFWLSVASAVFPILCFGLMLYMPETPLFLLQKHLPDKAIDSLHWLRGSEYDCDHEIYEMVNSLRVVSVTRTSIRDSFSSRAAVRAMLIAFGLMIFQQMSGVNAVIFYTVKIFHYAGSSIDGNIATIIVGTVQVVATFVSTLVADRVGRKKLLVLSSTVMAICLTSLGTYFYLLKNKGSVVSHLGWLPLASLALFIIVFSLGFGPVPWMMVGEILPSEIRSVASSGSCLWNWTLAFFVTKYFTNMVNALGIHTTFWIFGGFCVLATVFVIFVVIETKGKSLDDIQRELRGETSS